MNEANDESKKSQRNLIIIVASLVAAIAAGAWYFAEGETVVVGAEKPKEVSITPPGSVDDKDGWRGQIASKQSDTDRKLAEVMGKLESVERENKRLIESEAKLPTVNQDPLKEQLQVALPPVKGASSPVNGKTVSVLNSPLKPPTQNGGMNVGNGVTAGTAGVNNQSGQVSGGTQSAQAGQEEKPKAAAREVEIISFTKKAVTAGAGESAASGAVPPKVEVLGFPVDPRAKQYSSGQSNQDSGMTRIPFLPASSFVRVAMLNGVDAPTGGQAQGNPLPVALHVLDVANLANKFKLDIKDCRFIASAWGDLSSERMMGRTESLTCIINGEAMEMDVKGIIIGEDGKAGLRGRLVSKQGAVLANAVLAGIASGMGKAFNQAATTTTIGAAGISSTIDGSKVAQAGLGQGVSAGAKSLEDYYLKAADKLYPIIETDGGRIVEILITKGATLNIKNGGEQPRGLLRGGGVKRYGDSDD